MARFKYYIVDDEGDVRGTDSGTVASAASDDQNLVVINTEDGTTNFFGHTTPVTEQTLFVL